MEREGRRKSGGKRGGGGGVGAGREGEELTASR